MSGSKNNILKNSFSISRMELVAVREVLSECHEYFQDTIDIESALEIIDNVLYGEYDD